MAAWMAASASVIVCVSPSTPVNQQTIFSPQAAMQQLPKELNTAPWHCNNGVSAPLPSLLRGHKVLLLAPTITYMATSKPPYWESAYGQVVLNWRKK
jgi:hypothetical protein